jgi:hypothetical protein
MRKLYRVLKGIAAVAAMGAVLSAGTAQPAGAQAAPEKKVKDQGEYDLYNQVLKDTADPLKQIQDLDTWTQKYPDSEYKDDVRPLLYLQAYHKAKQPAKVLELGDQLLAKDLKTLFKDTPSQILTILYTICVNLAAIPSPTPQQLALGEKAAPALREFIPTFFVAPNKTAGATDAQWNEARATMEKVARDTQMFIATKPGADAMNRYTASKDVKECVAAEAAYRKALEQYADNPALAYQLGRALRCQQPNVEKVTLALYEFARAAAIDPTLGGTMDPKALQTYLEGAYSQYHGSLDGLEQLKQQAKSAPLPAAGFTIETKSALDAKKAAETEQKYPQFSLWLKIRGALSDKGEAYFAEIKDSAVPKLKGTLVEGKPACRSKELLVAVLDPEKPTAPTAEINLKLDAPLTGKPEPGTEIQWEGVPSAFAKDPFMLTMDTDKAKIEGLKVTQCAGAVQKKTGGATKKKQ